MTHNNKITKQGSIKAGEIGIKVGEIDLVSDVWLEDGKLMTKKIPLSEIVRTFQIVKK